MTNNEIDQIIDEFIGKQGYKNNPHVLGIIVCGSCLTDLYNEKSDIDINIVFDDSNIDRMTRGNDIIRNRRIEFFERPISEYKLIIENGYSNQSNAMLSIIGLGKVWYKNSEDIDELQEYAKKTFANGMPKIRKTNAQRKITDIEEKMKDLEVLAKTDGIYFNQLFSLVLEEITSLYHRMLGYTLIETAKRPKCYTDEKYRKKYVIDKLPEEFTKQYLDITSANISNSLKKDPERTNIEKYFLLTDLFAYVKTSIPEEDNQETIEKPETFKFRPSPLSYQKAREKMSIIDNKIEKLEEFANKDDPYFDFYYYLVTERLFNLYHERNGIYNIPADRIFKDDKEDTTIYNQEGINHYDEKFLEMYRQLLKSNESRIIRFQKLMEFYKYVTYGINLGKKYRIIIKSRVRKKI